MNLPIDEETATEADNSPETIVWWAEVAPKNDDPDISTFATVVTQAPVGVTVRFPIEDTANAALLDPS